MRQRNPFANLRQKCDSYLRYGETSRGDPALLELSPHRQEKNIKTCANHRQNQLTLATKRNDFFLYKTNWYNFSRNMF
jgi:hypothetical protein